MYKETEIDFVVLWVDPSDPIWIDQYNYYSPNKIEKDDVRYRNNELFKFMFRSFDKFTPWVRKIHFVTFGHTPKWLNLNHPKLNIVRHVDFIPKKYLPTFNAAPIEINIHRINGLSENFVLFNDDMYLLKNLDKEYFFYNGLPCDKAILDSFVPTYDTISNIVYNDMNIINKYFTMSDLKLYKKNWVNIKYGKHSLKNLIYLYLNRISAFEENHLPHSMKKSIFQELWQKEFPELDKASLNKFRSKEDINQWLFRYWQFCKNEFYPRQEKREAYKQMDDNIEDICEIIENQSVSMLCINDANVTDYNMRVGRIEESFNKILYEKSKYEK